MDKQGIDIEAGANQGEQLPSPVFFPVTPKKLIIMTICTFGLYSIYWHFANWWFLKNERGADISPFWRAFLSVFFCYPLFQNIEKEANESGIETKWKPKTLYFIFLSAILLGFISNGAHPMVSAAVLCFQIANPVIVMLPVQETINKLNHDQLERVINKRFSIYNYLAIAVGIIWLATVLIGVFSQ